MRNPIIYLSLSLVCLPVQAETFAAWAASYSLTGGDAAATADPDKDGVSNLMEYALDQMNPTVMDVTHASLPRLGYMRRTGSALGQWEWASTTKPPTDGTGGKWHLAIRFVARPATTGLRYVPQVSKNLLRWHGSRCATSLELLPGNVVQAVALTQGNRFSYSFMRLKVEEDATVTDTLAGLAFAGGGIYSLDTSSPFSQPRASGSTSSEEVTVSDSVFRRDTAPNQVTDFVWNYRPADLIIGVPVVDRVSSDSSKIIPSPTNPYLWTWTGNGSVTLQMRTQSSTYQQTVTTSTSSGGTSDVYLRGVAASLRAHLENQIDTRLATAAAALTSLPVFSVQDHPSGTYVRNTACWAASVDLTPLSPWNSEHGNHKAGTLISPRHVLFAQHYAPAAGCALRFIKADNTVVTRTLSSVVHLTQSAGYYPDFTVGLLDSDVPSGIAFCRVLPDAWAAKLPSVAATAPVLGVGLDQEEKIMVREVTSVTSSTPSQVRMRRPADATRALWYEDVIGGDSGNPGCLVINDKLVLLTVWTFGGGGGGTSVVSFKTALNAAMTTLGGGYQLTDADLSGFTSF